MREREGRTSEERGAGTRDSGARGEPGGAGVFTERVGRRLRERSGREGARICGARAALCV
jgi:hypothetical protein